MILGSTEENSSKKDSQMIKGSFDGILKDTSNCTYKSAIE